MRLGVDITPLQIRSPGGIGTATYNILKELESRAGVELVLYGRRPAMIPFSDRPLDLNAPVRMARGTWARAGNIAWLQHGIGTQLADDGIDVFWGTRHVLPVGRTGVARVATLYDYWYERYPDQQPFLNRTANAMVMRATMRDGDVFTSISDATARDAAEFFPEAASRVRTVLLGVDTSDYAPASLAEVDAIRHRLGVSDPYVLAMDVYNTRKNFSVILDAVAALGPDLPLTVVALGAPRATARDDDTARRVASAGLGERVVFAGDVSFDELKALYTGCRAFVYPSVYEGFGMPILEAMACGAPVICSDVSSLPEVAGDAAILVDPTSATEIASALESLLLDDGRVVSLRTAGHQRAGSLSWRRTADGMMCAFEDALALRRR